MLVDSHDDSLPDMSFLRGRTGIAVDVNDLYRQPRVMQRELHSLEQSPRWRLVYRRGGIYAFERR